MGKQVRAAVPEPARVSDRRADGVVDVKAVLREATGALEVFDDQNARAGAALLRPLAAAVTWQRPFLRAGQVHEYFRRTDLLARQTQARKTASRAP